MRKWALAGCLAAIAWAQAQAPPLVTQALNAASRMPPSLAGGSLARGSRVAIEGFRFGDAARVTLRAAGVDWPMRTLSTTDVEIQAVLPANAPIGPAQLTVVRDGKSSRPLDVNVVRSSFGISDQAVRGQQVILYGTGLGTTQHPEILVGGKPARRVKVKRGYGGADEIGFELPDAPRGCYVPVTVSSGGGPVSNTVTIPIPPPGRPCTNDNWLAGPGRRVLLARALLQVDSLPPGIFEADALLARSGGGDDDPAMFSPPRGTCTAYAGTAGLPKLASLLRFDATSGFTVQAASGTRRIQGSGILGGTVPFMKRKPAPLFLSPGEYTVEGARVRMEAPLPMPLAREIQIGSAFRLAWSGSESDDQVLVVLASLDQQSGVLGVCTCLASAADGRLTVPAESLANLPASRLPMTLPLGAFMLVRFPSEEPPNGAAGITVTARTVEFVEPRR